MPASPRQQWLDDFFRSYMVHRPVNATFVGIHDYDHRLPDLTESGLGDVLADMEGLLTRARRLGGERGAGIVPAGPGGSSGDPVEAWDLRLAEGFLRISLWEAESSHHVHGNPASVTGEAAFGILSLFLSDFAPLPERVEAAIRRLEALPDFLDQGRRRLLSGPGSHHEWTRRALRECSGMLAFLGDGVEALSADLTGSKDHDPGREALVMVPALRRAASTAAASVSSFQGWLEDHHLLRHRDHVGCGPEILDLHVREGHFLPRRPAEIAARAREEMAAARAWLDDRAGDFGAATSGEALARLGDAHPDADGYLDRYGEIWESCRRVAVERELVSWPDFPIRYVERPRWARAAAPWLYFLFYRSPAAWGRPPVHRYLVAPLPAGTDDGGADAEVLAAFLRSNNDAVIRANHVVHHGGLGHHVQNFHAGRAPSRVGRMAATDCAARIAMHCGGTMAEGWACYATDLMAELAEAGVEGGFTRLEAYAERASRVRMCARAVVDVELHSGRMSLEDAAAFYREHAGMSQAAATGEAVKNSMFPGMALMYVEGTDAIHELRREAALALGQDFRLRDFHDRFLHWGSVPVTVAGDLLRREWAAGDRPE